MCEQGPAAPSHKGAVFPLLETPITWLDQLCCTVDGDTLLQLFATCKTLRDLCLSSRLSKLDVQLPSKKSVEMGYRCLKLAAEKNPHQLVLELQYSNDVISAESSAAALAWMALEDKSTTNVLKRGMGELWLDMRNLVPHYVMFAFTELEVLTLDGVRILALPDIGSQVPVVQRIYRVNFINCCIEASVPTVGHQLRALPNIGGVTLRDCAWDDWALCLAEVGKQLQHIFAVNMYMPQQVAANLHTHFPQLQVFDVATLVVDDDVMEALLSMKFLHDLSVGYFHLCRSHNHHECAWDQVSMVDVHVMSLLHLPRFTRRNVKVMSRERWDAAELNLDVILPGSLHGSDDTLQTRLTAAVQQAHRWGGLQCSSHTSYTARFCIDAPGDDAADAEPVGPSLPAAQAIAALPLMTNLCVDVINFHNVHPVTAELLVALPRYCSRSYPCGMHFQDCTWAPGVLSSLLSALPEHSISLGWEDAHFALTDAQVMELGSSSTTPREVQVNERAVTQEQLASWNEALKSAGKALQLASFNVGEDA